MLSSNEKIEFLGNNIKIIVSNNHKFCTDTFLLADFSCAKKHYNTVDLGTGCGAIPLLWNRDGVAKHTVAVDIQLDACELLEKSIKINHLEKKISVINDDINNLENKLKKSYYDLVVCNPPYTPIGAGLQNEYQPKKIARHEVKCTIDDITIIASKLLKFGGKFCLCSRPQYLCNVIESMRKSGIEPKKIRFVHSKINKASKLFLIEGKRGRNSSGLIVLEPLILKNHDGSDSDEIKIIYKSYLKNKKGV